MVLSHRAVMYDRSINSVVSCRTAGQFCSFCSIVPNRRTVVLLLSYSAVP